MNFNPIRSAEIAGEVILRLQMEEFSESRPMGNIAINQLGQIIKLWLVGFDEETKDFLPRVYEWLNFAIKRNEKFGDSQNLYFMDLHRAAAIAQWLISSEDSSYHWGQAMFFNKSIRVEDKVYSKKTFSTWRIDDCVAFANLSKKYEEGIVEFENYHQLKSIHGLLKPREFAYAACCFEKGKSLDKNEIFETGRKMLREYLQEKWLGSGQFLDAAMWLRIVYKYREQVGLTPLEILLKAYEDMPDVTARKVVS